MHHVLTAGAEIVHWFNRSYELKGMDPACFEYPKSVILATQTSNSASFLAQNESLTIILKDWSCSRAGSRPKLSPHPVRVRELDLNVLQTLLNTPCRKMVCYHSSSIG
jgi:hypothetical protein